MLLLSTHKDESVVIDLREFGLGLIEVVTVEIRGDKVRNGYQGDKRIPIHRRKVFDAIEAGGADGPARARKAG
jgi:carbon storage regulator